MRRFVELPNGKTTTTRLYFELGTQIQSRGRGWKSPPLRVSLAPTSLDMARVGKILLYIMAIWQHAWAGKNRSRFKRLSDQGREDTKKRSGGACNVSLGFV